MPDQYRSEDAKLRNWRQCRLRPGSAILVGNGLSIGIHEEFKYPSLLEKAKEEGFLKESDAALFKSLGTHNFESVLRHLKMTIRTLEALPEIYDTNPDIIEHPKKRYQCIQEALGKAVRCVHIRWDDVSCHLPAIANALSEYSLVFTTNYDLILYWAVMDRVGEHKGAFKDFFWADGGRFDPGNTHVWDACTLVYYLHGGLHLRRTHDGGTRKVKSEKNESGKDTILEQFEQHHFDARGDLPLLVTEGTADDKMAVIGSSDYLSFAYTSLASYGTEGHACEVSDTKASTQPEQKPNADLVVYGHSFDDQDDHIFRAINRKSLRVFVSVLENDKDRIIDYKLHVRKKLGHAELVFFDAKTHPLYEVTTTTK